MSSPTISYRALDANGDPQWGQGQSNFLTDADAVALLIATRLRMFEGEWWANLLDGLPLWQSILGVSADLNAISLLIQQRILSTPFVVGMTNLEARIDPATRGFIYTCIVQTQFGQVQVTNIPSVPSQSLP